MEQPQKAMMRVPMPEVPKTEAQNFSRVWKNPAGLTMILDDTTVQFATDFANVVLRSFVIGQMQIAAAKKAAAEAKQVGGVAGQDVVNQTTNAVAQPQAVPTAKPSGIVLTD